MPCLSQQWLFLKESNFYKTFIRVCFSLIWDTSQNGLQFIIIENWIFVRQRVINVLVIRYEYAFSRLANPWILRAVVIYFRPVCVFSGYEFQKYIGSFLELMKTNLFQRDFF